MLKRNENYPFIHILDGPRSAMGDLPAVGVAPAGAAAIEQALGMPVPQYGHVPMILGNDGSRLSKRHGAVSVMQYREEGFLPEALLNYLVRLGWSHGDQEIFSIDEMIELFDIDAVNKAASSFNTDKLNWLNGQVLREQGPETLRRQHMRVQPLTRWASQPRTEG